MKPKLYFCRSFDFVVYAAAILAVVINLVAYHFTGSRWEIVVSFVAAIILVAVVENQYAAIIY